MINISSDSIANATVAVFTLALDAKPNVLLVLLMMMLLQLNNVEATVAAVK